MSEVVIKGRYVQKHDIEANWIKAAQADNPFIPKLGEIIIYDPEVDAEGNILELPGDRTYPYTYSRSKIGDGFTNVDQLPFNVHSELLKDVSDFDLVITSEEEFLNCLYMLHPNKNEDGSVDLTTKGEANPDFDYRYILVRNVEFTEELGTSDLDLAVFQPSLRYIKFDNCTWNAKWRVSGKAPTTLKFTGTEYERAPGDLQLVVDGIHITETNIVNSITYANEHPDKPSEFWGIGLRNIKGIINCTVDYPEDYKVVPYDTGDASGYTYSFKLTAQYFDYADNNKITGLWDGTNISNCHISEGIYRSSNCNNIVAMPILDENDALAPVQLRTCHNLSNFKGDFMDMVYGTPSYPECTAINYATCDWTSNKESFDFIIESQDELTKLLQNSSSFQNKRILLKNISLNPGNIAFTGASYVTFSDVEISEGATSLIGAVVFECSGLRFVSTQCRIAFKGSGNIRSRVYNMGAGTSINNIIGYCMYENCDGVSNSIIHFADKTSHIYGCIISTIPNSFDSIAGQDPWFRLCNDICGITVNSEASLIKFDRCTQLSHITGINASAISYIDCTKVDVLTCDNMKTAQFASSPLCPKPNRSDVADGSFALYAQKSDGTDGSKLAQVGNESGEIKLSDGIIPIRASKGHILVPAEPTENNHAVSKEYTDGKYLEKDLAEVGNETSYSDSAYPNAGTIPIRDTGGHLVVPPSPNKLYHAVSWDFLEKKLPDMSDYALKSQIPDTSKYALKSDIPNHDNFALKTEVCMQPNRTDVVEGTFALYAQNSNGNHASKLATVGTEYGDSITLGSGTVPVRASGGHLFVPITPTENNHAVSLQYLNSREEAYALKDAVCPKPNRSDLATGFALYAQKPDGSNGSKIAQIGNESGTVSLGSGIIPIRASNGQILVPITPTEANHAVSKQYLDSKLSPVDLTGYATEDWVLDQHFITETELEAKDLPTKDSIGGYVPTYDEYNSETPKDITIKTNRSYQSNIYLEAASVYEMGLGGIRMTSGSGSTPSFHLIVDEYEGGSYSLLSMHAREKKIGFTNYDKETGEYTGKTVAFTDDIPKILPLTEEEYNALETKDETMIYIIKE